MLAKKVIICKFNVPQNEYLKWKFDKPNKKWKTMKA